VPNGKDPSEVMLETMVVLEKAKSVAQMKVVHAWNPSREKLSFAHSTIRWALLQQSQRSISIEKTCI
jgi:hypothetical protein